MQEMATRVKKAALELAAQPTGAKNAALSAIARALVDERDRVLAANHEDLTRSEREGLAAPLLKRLRLDDAKYQEMVEGVESLVGLPDPVGRTALATELDDGLTLYRVTCPIGAIGIIFESRPDALVQISSLCLKSGNGVLLKGGSEAVETNRVLAGIIASATERAGMPAGWIQLLETRAEVGAMLKMDEQIDLIIPRGSNEFVRYIMENTKIPVLGHAEGVCHCYVDDDADQEMAVRVVVDAKTQYVAVCNAIETLLVHRDIAPSFLPAVKRALDAKGVTLFGCERTREVIPTEAASEDTWRNEYLDYKLSVKVVDSLEEAIDHINRYGSGHTDAIVTRSKTKAARFLSLVDSADVFWNCSTRFADGFRYGLGAEVGIATAKIHARGPVGLDGLVIYKYLLLGDGHVVADYAERKRTFKHRPLDRDFPL
jgi:glutamate-5-semialdehyde dehydrogenase